MAMQVMNSLPPPRYKSLYNKGFTLIELSIVPVIIGLIVGGVSSKSSVLNIAHAGIIAYF